MLEENKAYGFVGNAKNIYDLSHTLMKTGGVQNQLNIINQILASATRLKESCIQAVIEEGAK